MTSFTNHLETPPLTVPSLSRQRPLIPILPRSQLYANCSQFPSHLQNFNCTPIYFTIFNPTPPEDIHPETVPYSGSCLDSENSSFIEPKVEVSCKMESGYFEGIVKKEEFGEEIVVPENMRADVIQMLNLFLKDFGKVDNYEVAYQRVRYSHNQVLLQVFDCLSEKYTLSSKGRDDMIRFILRRAISSMRDNLRNKNKISAKDASVELCKKYFGAAAGKDSACEEDLVKLESEDEFLNFLLPYKKNSKNKTVNISFIKEIFSSDLFYKDYLVYLENFDQILEADNAKKIEKFINFLMDCIQNGTFHKIKKYKRLPWLNIWGRTTKIIAQELLNSNTWKSVNKRGKKMPKSSQIH